MTQISIWSKTHCKPKPCKAYRELPVSFFTGKNLFSLQGTPVLIAGSLFSIQGFPCKPLYFPVRDCSAYISSICFILIIVISIIPGGLLCCLSTLPHLSEDLSSDSMFNLALVGQALTGIACPFISCVPTKISQHWFNDEQRALATILLGKKKSIIGLVLNLFLNYNFRL